MEEDDEEVVFPHNDVIIVALNIKNYDERRIIIDNGISANILYFDTLMKMEISPDWLTRVDSPIIGFMGDAIQVEGMISLTMKGNYPLQSIPWANFLIVRAPSAYNTILKQLGINTFRAVVFTYYLKVKFSIVHGIREITETRV